jgi:hypothetical protein
MLEVQATPFVEAVARIESLLSTITHMVKAKTPGMEKPVVGWAKDNFVQGLKIIATFCPGFGARLAKVAAERMIEELEHGKCSWEESQRSIIEIRNRLLDELAEAKLFAITPGESILYEDAVTMFGDAVVEAFPSAVAEIDEAGKCLALGRVPATIFHLMRTVEIGLRSLAPSIGIADPNPSWNTVVRKIDKEVKLEPKDRTLRADYAFLEGVSAQMHAVNRAWRTRAMHVDMTFSLENAHDIFSATKALMQHLATQLSEPSSASAAQPS